MTRRPSQIPPGCLGHPLSYVRWERQWTYQDVVDVIARRITSANRREKAWRWEHWGVEPDADTQLALAAELGVPKEVIRDLRWPDWLPVGERIAVDTPWTVDGGLRLLADALHIGGGAVMDRRGFLILGAGVMPGIADAWLSLDTPRVASALRGGQVDADLVNCLEQRLPALRRMDHTLGGGRVAGVVDAELRLVTDLLTQGSHPEAIGRRLFAIAAELGRIAGWASCDTGRQAAAERYWVAALRAAHIADDRGIGANILKSMSLQRTETNRSGEALALARAAREGARGCAPRVVAMLTVRQARVHASRAETVECDRLLVDAERLMSQADDALAPPWAAYFDEAEYRAQVGACHLLLRRYRDSDRWLAGALAHQPDERGRDRATYLIWRADSALRLGEVDRACSLVERAIPDLSVARSIRNQRRLADLDGRIGRHDRVSEVRRVRERLRPLLGAAS